MVGTTKNRHPKNIKTTTKQPNQNKKPNNQHYILTKKLKQPKENLNNNNNNMHTYSQLKKLNGSNVKSTQAHPA